MHSNFAAHAICMHNVQLERAKDAPIPLGFVVQQTRVRVKHGDLRLLVTI